MNSDIHWKFQRYELWKETKNFGFLPPPLNLFYYTIIKPVIVLTSFLKKSRHDSSSHEIGKNINHLKCKYCTIFNL